MSKISLMESIEIMEPFGLNFDSLITLLGDDWTKQRAFLKYNNDAFIVKVSSYNSLSLSVRPRNYTRLSVPFSDDTPVPSCLQTCYHKTESITQSPPRGGVCLKF